MEDTRQNKRCNCLKAVDQTGVPVTLNWLGDSTHKTRVGGVLTIIGMFLVGSFVLGSIYTYLEFEDFETKTIIGNVNSEHNLNCFAEGNECQFLNSTTYMPFVLI